MRQYNREDTEKRTMKAALKIFAKKGYENTTTRMIAEKAKINLSLISRYFGGKEGLLKAIIESELQQLSAGGLNYTAQKDLANEIEKYFDTIFSEIYQKLDVIKLITSLGMKNTKHADILNQLFPQPEPRLVKRLKESHPYLIENNSNPEDLSQFVLLYMGGVFLRKVLLLRAKQSELEADKALLVNILLQMNFKSLK